MKDRDTATGSKEIWNPNVAVLYTEIECGWLIIAGSKIGLEIVMFQTDRRVGTGFSILWAGCARLGNFRALFLFVE